MKLIPRLTGTEIESCTRKRADNRFAAVVIMNDQPDDRGNFQRTITVSRVENLRSRSAARHLAEKNARVIAARPDILRAYQSGNEA